MQILESKMFIHEKRLRFAFGAAIFAFVLVFSVELSFAQAVGNEFQVNSISAGHQMRAELSMTPSGEFVVVWSDGLQDGSGHGVYARIFNSPSEPLGVEFLVNTETSDDQTNPTVAIGVGANFVVAWESLDQDGDSYGVYAQRFNSVGEPQFNEFQVNTYTTEKQQYSSVAMDQNGNFVIVWCSYEQDTSSWGSYGQRYNSSGGVQGLEFQINQHVTDAQAVPNIAMTPEGRFVVSWQSLDQDGDDFGVYARIYHADGSAATDEFLVNTTTQGYQRYNDIAIDEFGNFVVVWDSTRPIGAGVNLDIYGQMFSDTGLLIGNEFLINTSTDNDQKYPQISMNRNGEFSVAWDNHATTGDNSGLYAQRFDSSGNPVGDEFQANTSTSYDQWGNRVGIDDSGRVLIIWVSNGQDGDGNGIFGKYYECFSDGDCDDGLFCNGVEACYDGTCFADQAIVCPDDGTFCNGNEYCNEDEDRCDSLGDPCGDDGTFCNGDEICDEAGDVCDHENAPCPDDSQFCNGAETCNEATDECGHTGDPCGDDGTFCNGDEYCDEVGDQCLSSGNPCVDDDTFCNGDETCDEVGDICGHTGDPCPDDGAFCNGDEFCDEADDVCDHENAPCPDDSQFCNGAETCNEATDECGHTGDPCIDDGAFCNGDETCDEDIDECGHEGDPCQDDIFCNGVEECDEDADACNDGDDPCGDDGVWCNGDESCHEAGDECLHSGSPCDDGLFCTGEEICDEVERECAEGEPPCEEDETCDEENDECFEPDDDTGDDDINDDDSLDDDYADDDVRPADDDDDDTGSDCGCGC
jgi:hypothetical protein